MNFKVIGIAHAPAGSLTVTLHGDNGDDVLLITSPERNKLSIGEELSLQFQTVVADMKEETDASSADAAKE